MKKLSFLCAFLCALLLLLTACGQGQEAASRSDAEQSASSNQGQVASSSQMAPVEDVVDPDMVPIHADSLKDGVYSIEVDSSSSMFKIERCELTVETGTMTAVMHMGGTGYLSVFMGTGKEASREAEIPFTEEPAATASPSQWRRWTAGSPAPRSAKTRKSGMIELWCSGRILCRWKRSRTASIQPSPSWALRTGTTL